MELTTLEQATTCPQTMLSFEIVALGFDGGTDATDDYVLWVVAPSRSVLDSVLQDQRYAEVNRLPFELVPEQIDFVLPDQASALYEALRVIQSAELIVTLSHGPNPDINGGGYRSEANSTAQNGRLLVDSIAEASAVCRAYIENNGLGSGNWTGGQVTDKSGSTVARISYNGRAHISHISHNKNAIKPTALEQATRPTLVDDNSPNSAQRQ